MMRKAVLAAMTLVFGLTVSAHAAGLLDSLESAAGSANSASGSATELSSKIDSFLSQSNASSELFDSSKAQLAYALAPQSSKTKLASLVAKAKSAGGDATNSAVNSSAASILKQALASKSSTQSTLKNLSANDKTAVSNSLSNMALSLLQQKSQLTAGESLLKSASGSSLSDPSLLSKVSSLKDTLSNLKGNVSSGSSYLSALPTLLKGANISSTLPTSASSSVLPVVMSGLGL